MARTEEGLKAQAAAVGLSPALVAFLVSMARKYGPIALAYLLDLLEKWAQPQPLNATAPTSCVDHKGDCDQALDSAKKAGGAALATLVDSPECQKHQDAFEACLCACCCCEHCCESCP